MNPIFSNNRQYVTEAPTMHNGFNGFTSWKKPLPFSAPAFLFRICSVIKYVTETTMINTPVQKGRKPGPGLDNFPYGIRRDAKHTTTPNNRKNGPTLVLTSPLSNPLADLILLHSCK